MKRFIKILAVLAALAALAWWGAKKFGLGQPEKTDYLTEAARRGDIRKVVNATGEIGAVQLVNVGAQVSGQIKKLYVVLGQHVKKGDRVADIDSTTQENDLAINKAKLKTYEAQLVSRKIDLKVAQLQYDRQQNLLKRAAAAREELENAENALASAKAGVAETESLIEQTKISVSTAEVNLGYTRIDAPLDATVVSIPVEEGQTVNANQTTPTICYLADLSHMEIKMQISEADVTRLKPGMTVVSTILSEPDRRFRGKLASIDPGLTTLTDGSYSGSADSSSAVYYYGKFTIPNAANVLRIGMTTQNTIVIDEVRQALMVPTIAIHYDAPVHRAPSTAEESAAEAIATPSPTPGAPDGKEAGDVAPPPPTTTMVAEADTSRSPRPAVARTPRQAYVHVLEGNGPAERAVRRDVVLGISDNLHTEVKSGLTEGERVITAQMTASEIDTSINSRRGPGPGGPPRR